MTFGFNRVSKRQGRSIVSATPTPSPVAGIPDLANLIMALDPRAITPQADNSALSNFPDIMGGTPYTQATGANQPKYRSAASGVGANGQPCIQYSGNQFMISAKAGSALQAAIAANNYTLMIVQHGAQVQSNATPFTTHNSTTGIYMTGNGTSIGQAAQFFQADLTTLGDWVNFGNTCISTGIEATRGYVNGMIASQAGAYYGSGAYANFSMGMSPTIANNGFKGYIDGIYAWNRRLTPLEMVQFDEWCRLPAQWNQPDPRPAGLRVPFFSGNSITAGVSAANARFSYPNITRQAKGKLPGQWSNFGVGGQSWTGMQSQQAELNAVIAYLTAKGVICDMAVWEFYNSKGSVLATLVSQIQAYITSAYAAGISNLSFGTTCDYTGAGVEKTNYDNYWDTPANRVGFMNNYVPIHLDATIGVNGTCLNTTYFAPDKIHLTGLNNYPTVQSGYPILASLFTAVMP